MIPKGYANPFEPRGKVRLPNGQYLKGLLIGTEGMTDEGKTRWALTTPGNIAMISVDRNFEGVFDSPGVDGINRNIALKMFEPPLPGASTKDVWGTYHTNIRTGVYDALADPWSTTVLVDGDSDWWEVHILAHFGKNTQIYPQTRYAAPYAEKRIIISKMHDSGKIVICTNKVKDEYETVFKADGTPEKDPVNGEELRRKTGNKERQGFKDQDYLWNLQLRHLYKPAHVNERTKKVVPAKWGVRILKCKHNMGLVGDEIWGDQCNFRGLVEYVYPDVDPRRFGFAE